MVLSYLTDGFFETVWQHLPDHCFGLWRSLGTLELITARGPVGVHVLFQKQGCHLPNREDSIWIKRQFSQMNSIL